jgi:hypothetical protein
MFVLLIFDVGQAVKSGEHTIATMMGVILKHSAELKEQVMLNTRLLQELFKKQRGVEKMKEGKLPENVQFPLKSLDELTELEKSLKSNEVFKQVVSRLHFYGDNNTWY